MKTLLICVGVLVVLAARAGDVTIITTTEQDKLLQDKATANKVSIAIIVQDAVKQYLTPTAKPPFVLIRNDGKRVLYSPPVGPPPMPMITVEQEKAVVSEPVIIK
jgi:hypothetical protein